MRKKFLVLAAFLMVLNFAAARNSVELDVQKVYTEPIPLQTSEYADIWVKVVNRGDSMSENTSVEFVPEFPFSTDPDEKTEWNFGNLHEGGEKLVHFQVKVDENAVHGENTLKFRLNSGDSDITLQEKVPVEVRTDDEALTVTSIDFPEEVGPGTSNKMKLTVENMADSYLKNIDLNLGLSSEDLPFVTSETTRKRIQKIAPGENEEIEFQLAVDSGAETGVYKVPIELDYENEAGTGFSKKEHTGIVVGGEPVIETGINSKEIKTPGSSGSVTLRMVNRGEGMAKYAELSVAENEGYDILSSDSFYIGNIDSDDYQTAEVELYAEPESENLVLPVTISYRDTEGNMVKKEKEVDVKLHSPDQLAVYRGSGGVPIWIYGLAVLVIVGGIYYWRKRKR